MRPFRAAALLLASLLPLGAQVTLKMATLLPENSSWFRIVKDMGDTWARVSGGRVKVVFYPGGRQGDEPDVVRKMRLGSLQGAVLTSQGLAEIDRSVYALSIPLAFDNADEVYATLEAMRPGLEAAIQARGFVPLNWADGGWVRIFSRRPVAAPDDLRRQKLFQWAGDPRTLEIWKAGGFNAIPAPATELATGLQTGLLDAFLTSPQVVLVTRYHEQAPHMTDLKWGIILAGTVVTRDAWNRIPADVRPALLKAAQDAGNRLRSDMRATEERDLKALRGAGVKVVPVDAHARQLWNQMVAGAAGKIRGEFVPAQAYDEALKDRDAYRRRGK
ncbi:TRAP transporter substrate-binding protein [Mesoterricola silvestris]|uniref:C4-dicarboxylate ABC transporter substrate-binding protein n=1 Tax=Mesoterricola silvestris TaxID=2927979 RepID=A0AA48GH43_9BACT|nr:TRAP transporter substrate-binding protein DctP [Mesoterricola silvestris]BDU72746.1 hypothetical protein METEAL_19200 [Mesoterricola silvestris]